MTNYTLPKPRYTTAKLYTASQVQDAYTAGRAAGLEAAALMAEGHYGDGFRLADAIRNLASNAVVSGLPPTKG